MLSNQNVWFFMTVALTVRTCGPSTRPVWVQKTQSFSAYGKGVVGPILMSSTKQSHVGSKTPEVLRMLLEPITATWDPEVLID